MFSWVNQFNRNKSHYQHLHEKWLTRQQDLHKNFVEKHKKTVEWFLTRPKQLALSSLAGMIMLTATPAPLLASSSVQEVHRPFQDVDPKLFFMTDLAKLLPTSVDPLSSDEETKITQLFSTTFHMQIKAQLQGIRLDRNYGIIGKEQHLARYPGDSIDIHFDSINEANTFAEAGMAPGLGAWGYFAPSQYQMTKEASLREKYYIAVQTFLAPGYGDNVKQYNDFFKYRKMLVVNPTNGKAIVADIADAGPSPWTGKHLGGSPEVMNYLQRVDGAQKGPVLYFFIDDPKNEISLGPVVY